MTQTTIDYQLERTRIKRNLRGTELAVYEVLRDYPELRSIKKRNELIRKVWSLYEDYPAESITRFTRRFQANEIFDIEENQDNRANIQTAYNQYFNN